MKILNLLKKIIRRTKMQNTQELDLEILDQELSPFSYKWTKGDSNGETQEYESVFKDPVTGIIWVNFKGGSRINYSLLNDFMIQIDKTSSPVQRNLNALPAKATREAVVTNPPSRNIMLAEEPLKVESNPITTLLQKQKPNWVEVNVKLKLNLPTKSLYSVLTSSFEDADKEIIEFVVSDLDIEIIKESLRLTIKEIYKGNIGNVRKGGNNIHTEEQEH